MAHGTKEARIQPYKHKANCRKCTPFQDFHTVVSSTESLSSKEAKEPPIPPQFKKLLKKYEEITTCYLKAREVKYRGTHHINTQHIDD